MRTLKSWRVQLLTCSELQACQLSNYIGQSGRSLRLLNQSEAGFDYHWPIRMQPERSSLFGQVRSRFAALFRGYPLNFASNSPQYFAIITRIIFPSTEHTHWIWSLKILKTSLSPLPAAAAHTRRIGWAPSDELWWSMWRRRLLFH